MENNVSTDNVVKFADLKKEWSKMNWRERRCKDSVEIFGKLVSTWKHFSELGELSQELGGEQSNSRGRMVARNVWSADASSESFGSSKNVRFLFAIINGDEEGFRLLVLGAFLE